jgi:hypothetical protein
MDEGRLQAVHERARREQNARQLSREGYLEKQGDRVRLAVPLFGVWIVDPQGQCDCTSVA